MKDAKGDLFAGSHGDGGTDLAFYSGDDALNLAWLAHGGAGVVSVDRARRAGAAAALDGRRVTPATCRAGAVHDRSCCPPSRRS